MTDISSADRQPRRRDPEKTRARLLKVAVREFSEHGYEGARVERVVRAANVTTRMLYHYFGNKEQLYIAVLDSVYADIREGEAELELDTAEPFEALERLVRYTFDFFKNNDIFVRITRGENMLSGRYVKRSRVIRDMSQPLITSVEGLLARGAEAGVFRPGLDALQLYVSIVALGVHHINGGHTLSAVFHQDLMAPDWLDARQEHAIDMILSYVRA